MTTANTYLTFNGNCEEAFLYYKTVFGGEFEMISRFKEMPEDPKFPLKEEDKEKIMHVALPMGKEAVIMGSDIRGEWDVKFKEGNNFFISINTESKKEADRLFYNLSEEGKIIMPMTKTFWDSYFGNLVDKFGIQWMVSFDGENLH